MIDANDKSSLQSISQGKPLALIATMGITAEIVQFELETGFLNIPFEWISIVTTKTARSTADAIEWLKQHPSSYEIIDKFEDSPLCAGDLTAEVIHIIEGLRRRGYFVVTEPTGGRKWMAAAISAASAILGVPTIYVDVRFKDGKPDPNTMSQSDMTGVLEALAHLELKDIESAWASRNFPAVISLCKKLGYNAPKAFYRILGAELARAADFVHDIDRFKPYRKDSSPEKFFEKGTEICIELKRLADEWDNESFSNWLKLFNEYICLHASHVDAEIYDMGWIFSLLANAKTCMEIGRFDDAMARVNSALEWIAKIALFTDYGIQLDDRDRENNLARFNDTLIGGEIMSTIGKGRDYKKPSELYQSGLKDCMAVVRILNEKVKDVNPEMPFVNVVRYPPVSGGKIVWHDKYQPVKDFIDGRNKSVLAHGREAISREKAQKYYDQVVDIIETVTGEPVEPQVHAHILPAPPLTFSEQ